MSIERYLADNGKLIYTNKGRSMLPLLREGRDMFIITKKYPKRCKVGDVVLFRRGKDYVLHRVVDVRDKDYVILGDNCITHEAGITDNDILGLMTGFVRNGQEHSINELGYRLYVYVWMKTAVLRIFVKKVVHHVHQLCLRFSLSRVMSPEQ